MTDVSLLTAGLAGVASFLSPCVLPLVPGYLSYVSGISLETLRSETDTVAGKAKARRARLRTVTAHAGAFVLGFATLFVLLGASATAVGQFLLAHSALFTRLAGAVLVLFGLHIMGIVPIPLLAREKRLAMRTAPRTLLGAYGVGMLFAFGWTPCIGPILAALLTMAAVQETVGHGMTLLAIYALGLGVPFLIAAFCALVVASGWSLETVRHAVGLSRLPVLVAQSLPPGREAPPRLPPLALPDLAGQAQALRATPDEITVLNFWATWCVPCLQELPELVALHHQWQERGVHVVGVAIDSGTPADVRAFAARQGMDYALRLGTQQWARSHFGIFGLPVTLVVDRHGQIRQRLIGPQTGAQFETAIRPYL